MKVKFYGVRGTYPCPGPRTLVFGGNTLCVSVTNEVDGQIDRLVIDCGTGAHLLGRDLAVNFIQNKERPNTSILFTHSHLDHIQGFPFFAPNYFKQARVQIVGITKEVIQNSMTCSPIKFSDLLATMDFPMWIANDYIFASPLNSMMVHTMKAPVSSHPHEGANYYRITDTRSKRSVVLAWDHESRSGGDRSLIRFAKDCDLLIHDAHFTSEEYISDQKIVQGYGHSTFEMAIENATFANAKALAFIHFNPDHSDTFLLTQSKKYRPAIFARELVEIDIDRIDEGYIQSFI